MSLDLRHPGTAGLPTGNDPGSVPAGPGTDPGTNGLVTVHTSGMATEPTRARGRVVLAFVVAAVVLAECVVTAVAVALSGTGLAVAVDGFVVTNLAIGLSCGVAGWLIAWQRPANPLGWLLSAAAVCQASSATAGAVGGLGGVLGWSEPVLRGWATAYAYAWPWSIAAFLPLALLVFPDGLLPGRAWRAAVATVLVSAVVFVVRVGADPAGGIATPDGTVVPALVFSEAAYRAAEPLWIVEEILNLLVLVAAATGLVLRYRRGDEQRRRQLLWLVLALVIMIVVLVPWALFDAGPILQLLAIALVPAAMTIAVLRHQLLDIRLVLSRAVLYALLTAGVLGCWAGLVAGADLLLRGGAGPGTSALVTLLIAIAFNPVRVRLQRTVDRALYGDRADPVRAVARMGERLRGGSGTDLADVLAAVCEALRLPYAALRDAAHGSPPELLETGAAGLPRRAGRRAGRRRAARAVPARPRRPRRARDAGRTASPSPCTPPCSPRPSSARASRSSRPGRRSAAGCAATCTTGSGPPSPASRSRPTPPATCSSRIRSGPPHCWRRCGPPRARRSTTSAGSSTPCARRPSTSWAWSERCSGTRSRSGTA